MPFVVLDTSNAEDGSGEFVPIPSWAVITIVVENANTNAQKDLKLSRCNFFTVVFIQKFFSPITKVYVAIQAENIMLWTPLGLMCASL